MPSRSRSGKTSRSRGTTARTSSRTSSRKKTRKPQGPTFEISLRPEHQRELFALGLITVALVTLIFFFTGNTGGVGEVFLLGVKQLFGNGALVVPLALGILGVAILIQERLQESRFSGAHLIGTLLTLGMLLAMLEFPLHHLGISAPERFGKGGGLLGYGLVELLDTTIGRPAAVLVVLMLMLVGIMLTFNMTLREVIMAIAAALHHLRLVVWNEAQRQRSRQPSRSAGQVIEQKSPVHLLPGETSDIEPTPIAERPTRASLYRRADPDEADPVPDSAPSRSPAASAQPAPPAPSPHPPSPPTTSGENQGAEQERVEEIDVPVVHRAWPLPSLDLLDVVKEGTITTEERQVRSRLIEETLASFKVEARVVGVNTGPAITQFELQPAVGVKISKITTLEKDLALAMAAPSIRIEAPIPGKAVVGIEVPNTAISLVSLREVIDSEPYTLHRGKLKLPLGKDVSGIPQVADMTRMPHLLVAGSTGSGKSVAINSFLCGLLLKHTPDELRMIMIDPKMVELIVYNRVPHLLSPVVTELERVVPTLKWATREMERRYKVFARHGCRNLESYLKRSRTQTDLEPMPYILVVIDELADLMMMAPDEIETQICRLAQMARATGIHLIIATQRPSVDVITGLIKANFPSRIAFAVTSQIDSRVILDTPGAERLLGRGDMLYMAADSPKLVRMQGTFVSDNEVERLVAFWREATPPEPTSGSKPTSAGRSGTAGSQRPAAASEQQANGSQGGDESRTAEPSDAADPDYEPPGAFLSDEEQDSLLPQAITLVKQHRRASASLLQRRMRIGYSKAAQLIELLEQQGVVGPAEEGRSREVYQEGGEEG